MIEEASPQISFAMRSVAGPIRRWQLLLMVAATLLLVLPGDAVTPFIAVLLLCAFLAETWLSLRVRRLRAQLRAEDYRVCLVCGGRLGAKRAAGQCLQCGTAIDVETLKRQWEALEL
jgi:UPF0716 family protein affecting phage T7 exclusion